MERCPCRTEVFSRVIGFFRPVNQWNAGKQEEFKDRKGFQITKKMCKPCQKIAENNTEKVVDNKQIVNL